MNSVSNQDQYAPSLFFCPMMVFGNEEEEFRFVQFGESPLLSPTFSHQSSYHTRPLDLCKSMEGEYLICRVCLINMPSGTAYYSCSKCLRFHNMRRQPYTMGYHKECIEPLIEHPYHPKHSLRLQNTFAPRIQVSTCLVCSNLSTWHYSCSICNFNMCRPCSKKEALLEIDNPKTHKHTVRYNYRKSSLICDICALGDHEALMYSCGQCDFMVHKNCIYFPYIIRISRHEHCISFSSSLTPEKISCGVCHKKINTNYGRYSCVKGCNYGVHSKCATIRDIWDGEELESVPEDVYEDIRSFIDITEGIIQHFSHQNHHMRLDEKIDREFDENMHCQACTLPIYGDIIYSCVECDFILHQKCAHLPRKKYQVMHPHRLSLRVDTNLHFVSFRCTACNRYSNGFAYVCCDKDCHYKLDVRCASISEPLYYQRHHHPLLITFRRYTEQVCSICHISQDHRLNCQECTFVVCFGCATLPKKARHRSDEHVLLFYYGEHANGQYFCEVCEKESIPEKGVYMCKDCNFTLHIECLLGKDINMMPSGTFPYESLNVPILLNNRLTRNICTKCNTRCEEKLVYKISDREFLCSFDCLYRHCL